MNDLDKKLLEAVYKGVSLNKLNEVPKDSVNWFKATHNGDVYEFVIDVGHIKQAFVDAGYVQIPNLKPGDYIGINQGEIRLNGDGTVTPVKRMTGQEWHNKFIAELHMASGSDTTRQFSLYAIKKIVEKAAGIEQ